MSIAPLSALGTVGPYELIHPLGAGGMAETFLAIKRGPAGFEQRVCVKRILAGYTSDATFVELFLDEARLLANMQCANIVQVYDFGEADGTYYMALELVDGGDLSALLRWLSTSGKQLSSEAALWIAGQLLRGLHYAHTLESDGEPLRIVHRDISPSNLLVSRAGEVKLTDFGIAKSTKRSHKTRTGQTKGKLAYMSPEQVQGKELDARSDLFSTGTLLYELLTGVHPFEAPTDLEMLNNIIGGIKQPLAALAPGQPKELLDLVDAMLAPAVEARPPSAADALDRLAAVPTSMRAQEDLAQTVREYREAKPLPSAGPGSDPRSGVRMGSSDGNLEVRSGHTVALDSAGYSEPMLELGRKSRDRTGVWLTLAVVLLGSLAAAAAYVLLGPDGEPADVAASNVAADSADQAADGDQATETATAGEEPRAASSPAEPSPEREEAAAAERDTEPRQEPTAGQEIILNQPGSEPPQLREPRAASPRRAERPRRDHRASAERREAAARRAAARRAAARREAREQAQQSESEPAEKPTAAEKKPNRPAVPGRSGAQISADEF